ncbi:hypothetical protein HPP92_012967 [Vanilla planifolia]|uniref:Uncharacterized protein n=1 Tax=Vanilla planifolia TaxID=51239 RepID=A0A835R1I2_VANPL|nr:hypothetical protein HPP92_013434 [Vanilla planifolia]KAG0478248.1 hypothetical protein HPP92_012967 [Vanilla planifolia]
MRWESVQVVARARETPDGKKSSGRTGGIWGPGKRWGHSCNSVKGGRYIYVFGGYGADTCQTNDVHVFDTVKKTWSKPMMKGEPPSPRDSHSCTTVGRRLFVFGGTDGMSPLNDLHILDTFANTWISPTLHGKGPDAREGHSAALVDKRLFIFGGCGKSGNSHEEVYYNDLYILDTETLVWECAMTSGVPPVPRDSHTCSSWKSNVIVLGGEDASDCYLSDVHMLDADTLTWRQITTSGHMLAPRAGHTTVALGNNLFVFGGFTDARNLYDDLHVLNVESGNWSRVTNINNGPSARFSGAGDCLDEQRGILVFLGGCNKSLEALDDMYYLYTGKDLMLGKELKRRHTDIKLEKCSGVPLTPVRPGLSQLVPMLNYAQAGEEIAFEARVTGANQYGYAIETIVNGKPLRGMLFSCTSHFGDDGDAYVNKSGEPLQEMLQDPTLTNSAAHAVTKAENVASEKPESIPVRNETSGVPSEAISETSRGNAANKDEMTSQSTDGNWPLGVGQFNGTKEQNS